MTPHPSSSLLLAAVGVTAAACAPRVAALVRPLGERRRAEYGSQALLVLDAPSTHTVELLLYDPAEQ